MGKLTERYPGIKRLQVADAKPNAESLSNMVEPYLEWQLVEIDTATSDILIQRPTKQGEAAKLDDLLVLVGPVAAAWLRRRQSLK